MRAVFYIGLKTRNKILVNGTKCKRNAKLWRNSLFIHSDAYETSIQTEWMHVSDSCLEKSQKQSTKWSAFLSVRITHACRVANAHSHQINMKFLASGASMWTSKTLVPKREMHTNISLASLILFAKLGHDIFLRVTPFSSKEPSPILICTTR